jgi:hypothetical protein
MHSPSPMKIKRVKRSYETFKHFLKYFVNDPLDSLLPALHREWDDALFAWMRALLKYLRWRAGSAKKTPSPPLILQPQEPICFDKISDVSKNLHCAKTRLSAIMLRSAQCAKLTAAVNLLLPVAITGTIISQPHVRELKPALPWMFSTRSHAVIKADLDARAAAEIKQKQKLQLLSVDPATSPVVSVNSSATVNPQSPRSPPSPCVQILSKPESLLAPLDSRGRWCPLDLHADSTPKLKQTDAICTDQLSLMEAATLNALSSAVSSSLVPAVLLRAEQRLSELKQRRRLVLDAAIF